MGMTYNPKYNTYIGARYVPLICGEWDNTKQYEPLSIVTHQGNSYTSKTYVPVGVDIANETYWVLTGSYNAQFTQLQENVNRNTEAIANITTEIEPIPQIEKDVAALQAEITQVGSSLKGIKTVFMGDSLSIAGSKTGGKGWAYYTQLYTQVDATIYGNGGAGFDAHGTTTEFEGMNFNEMLLWIESNVPLEEREKVKLFVCFGGINDAKYADTTPIYEHVKRFSLKVNEIYPNAKAYVIPLHTFKNLTQAQYKLYDDIYRGATLNYSASTKDFIWLAYGWQSWAAEDFVHMSNTGYKLLASNISSFLQGGTVNDRHNIGFTPNGDAQFTQSNIVARIDKNVITLNGLIRYIPTKTINLPQYILIGNLDDEMYTMAKLREVWYPTFIYNPDTLKPYIHGLIAATTRGVNMAYFEEEEKQLIGGTDYYIYCMLTYEAGYQTN